MYLQFYFFKGLLRNIIIKMLAAENTERERERKCRRILKNNHNSYDRNNNNNNVFLYMKFYKLLFFIYINN